MLNSWLTYLKKHNLVCLCVILVLYFIVEKDYFLQIVNVKVYKQQKFEITPSEKLNFSFEHVLFCSCLSYYFRTCYCILFPVISTLKTCLTRKHQLPRTHSNLIKLIMTSVSTRSWASQSHIIFTIFPLGILYYIYVPLFAQAGIMDICILIYWEVVISRRRLGCVPKTNTPAPCIWHVRCTIYGRSPCKFQYEIVLIITQE